MARSQRKYDYEYKVQAVKLHLLFTFRCETASDNFQQFPDLGNSAF